MSWHLVQCRNDCSPPWKNLSFTVEGENNFKPRSGKWEPYSLKGKKNIICQSIIYFFWHLMKSHLPACFVWAFFPKFRSVTVPYSQSHSHSECTHQSISWKSDLPDTPAMQVRHTNIFLLGFCLCKRPCFPPRTQIPATWEAAERAGNQKVPPHGVTSAAPDTEVGNNRSPPTGAPFNRWQGQHTHPALPTASPPSPKHSWFFPRPFTQEVR